MTTTAMMMYWKPDKVNTLASSMLGRLSAPNTVELRGIYLEETGNEALQCMKVQHMKMGSWSFSKSKI